MIFFKTLLIIPLIVASLEAKPDDTISTYRSPGYLCFYSKLSYTTSEIEIPDTNSDNELMYESNAKSALHFGVHYSWFGLDYSFSLPSTKISQYGRTTQNSFSFHYKKHRLIADLKIKNYKGYYLANPEDYDYGWKDESIYPQVSDLKTKSTVASVTYVFNPDNYYANAAYSYKNTNHRSGGSWLLRSFVTRNSILSDSSIVPSTIRQYVDPGLHLKTITATDIGISVGYSYLLVLPKKLFASFTLFPGLSFQQVKEQSSIDESIKKFNSVSPQLLFHLSIGHNTETYNWGLATQYESANTGSELSLELETVGLFFIYRIDTNHWKFMKNVDKVMHPRFLRFVFGNPPKRV